MSNLPFLARSTGMTEQGVANTLALLEEGATIPFIARYRKERTGGADDGQLRLLEEAWNYGKKLAERKEEVLRLIAERGRLDEKLKRAVEAAESLAKVEDLYRPFKEKKNTRAGTAIANGLEPLADLLGSGSLDKEAFMKKAAAFANGKVATAEEAMEGARDILAERYADDPKEREILREAGRRHGSLEMKKGKSFDENGVYKRFPGQREKLAHIPSYRYLAIMRGVREKELSAKIAFDTERTLENIRRYKIPRHGGSSREWLFDAYADGLKRLLLPSVERELHGEAKEKADRQAVEVFGKNLEQLLMTPPVAGKVILGVDPGFRTGCKVAVIDENGDYLDSGVIYPVPPKEDYEGSKKKTMALVRKYGVTAVAVGNGTASRETQAFLARVIREENPGFAYTVVSEAGASVYSASDLAAKEYPELDVTIRGAVSIAQRLRDPMAALVKIDPKALGVGQYQHDVDQKLLEKKLGETVERVVNRVGVDVNSASAALLAHVAGIGPKLAETIVKHRESHGRFPSRKALTDVKGLGAKAFQQCAGFLRIRDGEEPLDNTGVHPESYPAARKLLKDRTLTAEALEVGEATLRDILTELEKPGFDPRNQLPEVPFREDVTNLEELHEGSVLSGVVRSITDFGAFVDVGLKNDGLIHVSQMGRERVRHPMEVVSVNQYLPRLEVVSIDRERGKIGLRLD